MKQGDPEQYATNRQIKVIKFFKNTIHRQFDSEKDYLELERATANKICAVIFMTKGNAELWTKYLYLTGDSANDNAELYPFDPEEFEKVVVPKDWRLSGKKRRKIPSAKRAQLEETVLKVLEDGSPFDNPIPNIEYPGKHFLITGLMISGSKETCYKKIVERGGICLKNVSTAIDYLIIGGKGSSAWKYGQFGEKIKQTMLYKIESLDERVISIISEDTWLNSLKAPLNHA